MSHWLSVSKLMAVKYNDVLSRIKKKLGGLSTGVRGLMSMDRERPRWLQQRQSGSFSTYKAGTSSLRKVR